MSAKVMEARVDSAIKAYMGRLDERKHPGTEALTVAEIRREAMIAAIEAADKARGGEAVPFMHVMLDKDGEIVARRRNTGFGFNFTVADFIAADEDNPKGAPHTGKLLYDHPADGVDLEQFRQPIESWQRKRHRSLRNAIAACKSPELVDGLRRNLAEAQRLLALIDQHSKGRSDG